MGLDALKGFEKFTKPKVKKAVNEAVPEPVKTDETQEQIVRIPRTTPAAVEKHVSKMRNGMILSEEQLAKREETRERRIKVTDWLMNGHTFNGKLMDVNQLAKELHTPRRFIYEDVNAVKTKFAKFYTEKDDTTEVAALAHLLMEMKFQDRGRALLLYNIIMGDIKESDAKLEAAKQKSLTNKTTFKPDAYALTGRDRAAMYSAALAALGEASKATNGMDQLFKMTGGAAKLQLIIKNATFNNNKTAVVDMTTLQNLVSNMMGSVLPSNRPANSGLSKPSFLEMDNEDMAVMAIGEAEVLTPRGKRGRDGQEN